MADRPDPAKYCPVDKIEYPAHFKFCEKCGQSLVSKPRIDKGVAVRCPQCREPIERGVKFCQSCGANLRGVGKLQIPPLAKAESGRCPRCNAAYEKLTPFCHQCGVPLGRPAGKSSVEPTVQPQEALHCPNPECNAAIDEATKFCESCGWNLQTQVEQVSQAKIPTPPIETASESQAAEMITSPTPSQELPETIVVPQMQQPVVAEPQTGSCPQCTAPLDADTRFCEECGFEIKVALTEEQPLAREKSPGVIESDSARFPPGSSLPTTDEGVNQVAIEPAPRPDMGVVPEWTQKEVEPMSPSLEAELTEEGPSVEEGTFVVTESDRALVPPQSPSTIADERMNQETTEPAPRLDATLGAEVVEKETEPLLPSLEDEAVHGAEEESETPQVSEVTAPSQPEVEEVTERRRVRRALITGVSVAIVGVLGVGGWYLYEHHAPTQAHVNQFLINIGAMKPTLIVRTDPPRAQVFIDGQEQGATHTEGRLVLKTLERGAHTILLSLEGYETLEQHIDLISPEVEVDFTLARAVPEGMVYVPGGTFQMGRDDGDQYERLAHEVTVKPFFIDKYELTCEEYQEFIDETGYSPPPGWPDGRYPGGGARLPVTGVSWEDAHAYAQWAGKRLPTEEEWEFAARGTDGRLYPWGNEWKPNMANAADTSHGGIAQVGSHAKGASPFGAFDMVGNVWEWTASEIRSYPGGHIPEDSWSNGQRRRYKIIRGGCYLSDHLTATTTYRTFWPVSGQKYDQTGFRCVKDIRQ